jgi:transposase
MEFDCECDARKAVDALSKKLKLMRLEDVKISQRRVKEGKGRPKKDAPENYRYAVQAVVVCNDDAIQSLIDCKGKFVIATNELDREKLPAADLLNVYTKGQQSVERGFRFLKDPMFMTSSVFLKLETRICALSMVMCLCLLVYTLAQRLLRKRLELLNTTLPNQLGKPTQKPTMRWIFQIFEGVHVLIIYEAGRHREIILNPTPLRTNVLKILGPPFEKIYENAA